MPYISANQTSNNSELGFAGSCSYDIQNGRVRIQLDEIRNQRNLDSISGTLSVELWALHEAYAGGDFSGVALAGTQIGELLDGHALRNCRYELIFQEPPAGNWQLVLMLREWTGSGFETRDQLNFALPYHVSEQAADEHHESDKVISIDFSNNGKAEADDSQASAQAKPTEAAAQQPTPADDDGATDDAQTVGDAPQKHAPQTHKVSLNHAGIAELAQVKGLSRKKARAIVEARPFKDIKELRKIKGIDKKDVKKLKHRVEL